jgi:hypothetical protein
MSWRDALAEALGGEPEVVLEVAGVPVHGGRVSRQDVAGAWSELARHAGEQGHPVVLGTPADLEEHAERTKGSREWANTTWSARAVQVYEALGAGVSLADLNDEEEGPGALRGAALGVAGLPGGPLEERELLVGLGMTGRPLTLAWAPARAGWELPVVLRFGGVDDNPPPWIHAGLLRRWSEEWGARLVTLGHHVLEVRVERAPATWPAAFELAQEQADYCPALVRGGANLKTLAGRLKAARVWTFVWA